MSRAMVGALLLVFAAILAIGYIGLTPFGDNDSDELVNDNGIEADDADPVALGEAIYSAQCAGCHNIDGSDGVGPNLDGLYNSEVEMDDGETVVADRDYLITAITDPRATTREGFPDVMPAFDNLSEDEVAGLVDFIESLE